MNTELLKKIEDLKGMYADRLTIPNHDSFFHEVLGEILALPFQEGYVALRKMNITTCPAYIPLIIKGPLHGKWNAFMNKMTHNLTGRSLLFNFWSRYETRPAYTGKWQCLYTPDEIMTFHMNGEQAKSRMTDEGRFVVYTCDDDTQALVSWKAFWMGKNVEFINSKGQHKQAKQSDGASRRFNSSDFEIVNIETKETIACSILSD